ncbi:MAG: alpha-amylase family glycosyl hydrolase [Sumerlaeia bacterium]
MTFIAISPKVSFLNSLLASAALGFCATQPIHAQSIYQERDEDWRNGALVYQVIVDRFAPSENLAAKLHLYPEPKKLRPWNEDPTKGEPLASVNVWSHEIDFWGGDLNSLSSRLTYIEELGMEVLYLNPIHQAYTNHKYDAQDYFAVSEEYGTRDDVRALAQDVNSRNMRLMLDGVFNHMGRTAPIFQEALANSESPWRDWFIINENHPNGFQAWYNVANLPEVNLENPNVRARLWGDSDSVIQGYLRDGVSGWRLDVAFDIGPQYLRELTDSAHSARQDALVIGEIWNYPPGWFPYIDAVMNMTQRELILGMIRQQCTPVQAKRMMDRMVADTDDYEALLRSWVMIDNHDTARLRTVLDEEWKQRQAQVLQFTLPGSPCIYYGVELGMEGGQDPEMRGPMRWELVNDDNPYLNWFKTLVKLRQENPALRVGDYVPVETEELFAFIRKTDLVQETVLVIANPTNDAVQEFIMPAESLWMSASTMVDQLSGAEYTLYSGTIDLTVPPRTTLILKPRLPNVETEYSPYKRVQ